MSPNKLFLATIATETNTFSPFVTSLRDYEEGYLVRGGNHPDPDDLAAMVFLLWKKRAEERGWEVFQSLNASAQPAGLTLRSVYEAFRSEVIDDLRAQLPVDAVLLDLHGAMVAEGYDDCEGDLIAHVREIVGPNVPIGVELDLHCHLTELMVEKADVIIAYKEYPHTDVLPRAEELFQIIMDTVDGKVKPTMALYDCGMIGVFHTSQEPVKSFVRNMEALEGKDGVLSATLGHGFPWGDVPEMGTRMLVVTDNDQAKADRIARELGEWVYEHRDTIQPAYRTVDEAVEIIQDVLPKIEGTGRPIVLADVSDNAGGGASSDSTFVLKALIDNGISNAIVGLVWDPMVVGLAESAGVGARFPMRVGGKMSPLSGDPLDLDIEVLAIGENSKQTFGEGGIPIGTVAILRAHQPDGGYIDIAANTLRCQLFHPDAFEAAGVKATDYDVVIVKSMQHFHAGFAPIASQVEYIAAPGTLVPDFTLLPYKRARTTIWPMTK